MIKKSNVMLKSLCSAFLMYSRIPVPVVEWNDENKRYALCCFPLIGIPIGFLFLCWTGICIRWGINRILFSVVSVCIPIWITGGIHLDGFCDVTDAKNAFCSPEKRLIIMHDPHIGAFAVIYLCLYLLLQTALFTQISDLRTIGVISCGYILSRAYSGLSAICIRPAKETGSLQNFVAPADQRLTLITLSVIITAACIGMIMLSPITGATCAITSGIVFLYYLKFCDQYFGGVTGDLCGWFLQTCELWMLIVAIGAEVILT